MQKVFRLVYNEAVAESTTAEYSARLWDDFAKLAYSVVELANLCRESRLAGGNVSYEVLAYLRKGSLRYRIRKYGTVIGGPLPAPLLAATLAFALQDSCHSTMHTLTF